MPEPGRTIFIAGAGIAGLTLALALSKRGATVVVLERNAAISEFGAGLQISPNAGKVLDNLGLSDALVQQSLEPGGIDIYPLGHARPLVTMELGPVMRQRFGAPYTVMHRADLAELLHRACQRAANIDILFGVRNWEVVSHARGVTVSIDEGDGRTRTSRGHAFVGADGVHSRTRRQILGGPDARYGGRIAWRTLVPFDSVAGHLALDRVSVLFGLNHHLVCYPLPHRAQVNLALFSTAREDRSDGDAKPQFPSGLGKSHKIAALLAAAGDTWTPWPLYTVNTPLWHKGNIGLIGDAAHAMVPFQAQGAAMAIEDTATLAPLLMDGPDSETAFSHYAAERQSRVRRVARTSSANGRIFHLPWPLSLARDLGIRLQGERGHLRRLAWLYGYEAHAEAAAKAPR